MSEIIEKCRLCLRKIDGVNGSTITDQDFRKMLSSVFNFWIPNGYGLPKSVCLQCYISVRDFYYYSNTVQANQHLLMQDPLQLDCVNENEKFNDLEVVDVKMESIPDDGDEEDDDALTDTASDCGKESELSAKQRNYAAGSPTTTTFGRPNLEAGSRPTEEYSKAISDDNSSNAGPAPSTRKRKTTSNADREGVVEAYENGIDTETICKKFHLNKSTVYGIIKKFLDTGVTEAGKRGGTKKKKLMKNHVDRLKALVDEDCSIPLRKLKDTLREEFGINVSISTISRNIGVFNYSIKRIKLTQERRTTQDNIELRYEYANKYSKLSMTPKSEHGAVFVDEASFKVIMRCTKDSRDSTVVPQMTSRRISIACAMNSSGIVHFSMKTRPFDRELFLEFIKEVKEKLSTQNVRQTVMIMDYVRFHKGERFQNAVEQNGHEILFLPPCSPFLNPIENLFSQWKQIAKRANPQNETELINVIKIADSYITSADCAGYMSDMCKCITKCLKREPIVE